MSHTQRESATLRHTTTPHSKAKRLHLPSACSLFLISAFCFSICSARSIACCRVDAILFSIITRCSFSSGLSIARFDLIAAKVTFSFTPSDITCKTPHQTRSPQPPGPTATSPSHTAGDSPSFHTTTPKFG
jgi:hypothetical protein